MRAHLSPVFCCNTNPRPCRLASVQRRVGLSGSKKEIVGADVRDCFAVTKAWSRFGDQVNSFFVLSKGRSGASRPARVAVLAESWFARPKKERRSVRFVGVGNSDIASVIDWSMQ